MMRSRILPPALAAAALCLTLAAARPLRATWVNPKPVAAVAVFQAGETTSDAFPPDQVNYNITNPDILQQLFAAIDPTELLDCSDLDSKDSAYLYVRYTDGTTEVYDLLLLNSHVTLANIYRVTCYFVDEPSRDMFTYFAQSSQGSPPPPPPPPGGPQPTSPTPAPSLAPAADHSH